MKKYFYIFSFTVLGVILQLLIHAIIEIWYLDLLLKDFGTYGFGFSWRAWFVIHHISTVILLVSGIILGFWQGKFWWAKLYLDDRRRKR